MTTDTAMLVKQEKLAAEWHYKKFPPLIALIFQQEYRQALPPCFSLTGETVAVLTKEKILITHKYDRIVIGDYGAFLEIDDADLVKANVLVKPSEAYRLNDPQYAPYVKYHWFTARHSQVKLYYQQKTVTYADYKPGKWYVSLHEVILQK